jgi:hypothetical protein
MVMSPLNENARSRITEIVTRAGGDKRAADAAIRTLVKRDHAFLLDLVEPFLDGIVAHALAGKTSTSQGNGFTEIPNSRMNEIVRGMTAKLGVSPDAAPPRQKTSAGHADTIRALAAAQARNRKDQ